MSADIITLYVPCLHPASVPPALDGQFALFDLGIPANAPGGGQLSSLWSCPLPFTPAEVAATLRMMHETTLDSTAGASFAHLASRPKPVLDRAEMHDLSRFASGESALVGQADSSQAPHAQDTELQARSAHLFLLYAFFLEQRLAEIRDLEQTYHGYAASFAQALGEDEDGLSMRTLLENMDGNPVSPPAWKMVVEHMGFFLVEGMRLVTAEPQMVRALHETGFCSICETVPWLDIQSAPEHVSGCGSGFLWAALGYAQAPPDKPWLDKKISIATIVFHQ